MTIRVFGIIKTFMGFYPFCLYDIHRTARFTMKAYKNRAEKTVICLHQPD